MEGEGEGVGVGVDGGRGQLGHAGRRRLATVANQSPPLINRSRLIGRV